jgi:uncharacterized membrane protein
MFYIKLYLSTLLCFLAVDLLWLGVIARGFYQEQLEFLLRSSPNWPVAILFYMIYITGILVFVVSPALQAESWRKALLLGAFFGFVTYATYDLTNHATVNGWPWIVSVVDLCWGTILCSTVATCGYFVGKWLSV